MQLELGERSPSTRDSAREFCEAGALDYRPDPDGLYARRHSFGTLNDPDATATAAYLIFRRWAYFAGVGEERQLLVTHEGIEAGRATLDPLTLQTVPYRKLRTLCDGCGECEVCAHEDFEQYAAACGATKTADGWILRVE